MGGEEKLQSFLDALAKLRESDYCFRHVRPSARLPLDGFSWKFKLQYFAKTYLRNSSFVEIWKEKRVLYMTTNFW